MVSVNTSTNVGYSNAESALKLLRATATNDPNTITDQKNEKKKADKTDFSRPVPLGADQAPMSGPMTSSFTEVVDLLKKAKGDDFKIQDYAPYEGADMFNTIQNFFKSDDANSLTDEQYNEIALSFAKEMVGDWAPEDRSDFLAALETGSVEVISRNEFDNHPLFDGADSNYLDLVQQLNASGKVAMGIQLGNKDIGFIF